MGVSLQETDQNKFTNRHVQERNKGLRTKEPRFVDLRKVFFFYHQYDRNALNNSTIPYVL